MESELHGICEAAIAFSGVEMWRDDIIENCENDISYLVPSNSSTSTVPYSPNAPNQNVINKACTQGVNLFLLWSAIKFLIFNLLLSVYFGTIVEAFSREELQKQDLQKQELIS
ncbi:hypothetical protein C2G38_2250471 [Gigaspora rosea]|uniref:Ion transport domain-containing protein n=1 Tax=Gigaspora rosea TaxID=44941 RepID=A0A397UNR9_9GLOM|nr:hypothetical protein C2G38_2250471 [Gigaspora rosea]